MLQIPLMSGPGSLRKFAFLRLHGSILLIQIPLSFLHSSLRAAALKSRYKFKTIEQFFKAQDVYESRGFSEFSCLGNISRYDSS